MVPTAQVGNDLHSFLLCTLRVPHACISAAGMYLSCSLCFPQGLQNYGAPRIPGAPRIVISLSLDGPLCAFLPRHWPGWMAHATKLSAGTTALCWLSWPFGKGFFYSPQSLSKGSQSQHGASSFLPQQFPNSGYQPEIQPPEPLIRKVLRNVLKERTGEKERCWSSGCS